LTWRNAEVPRETRGRGEPRREIIRVPSLSQACVSAVRGEAIWDGYDPATGQDVNPPAECVLIQCDRCGVPAVQVRENYGPGFDTMNQRSCTRPLGGSAGTFRVR
jgi:hypothetical protein